MAKALVTPEQMSVPSPRGTYVQTMHTVRPMTLYGIYENEMESLSLMNGVTGVFSSIGTGLLAFAAGQVVDLVKTAEQSQQQGAVVTTICRICCILAIACYAIAGWAFWKRRSQIGRIKTESKATSQN